MLTRALTEVLDSLRCPICGGAFPSTDSPTLRCPTGHSFDVSRKGYVNLLTGKAPAGAETPEMVAARAELLGAGHFDTLARAVADAAEAGAAHRATAADSDADRSDAGLVVDVGAGTGYYLAAVLERLPDRYGLALDVAKAAVRYAARAHPRAAAAVCDAWRRLPLADGCAAVLLNIFAPRNQSEFRRVLRPDGVLLVVSPRPDHLGEFIGPLGLLSVDPEKDRRLTAAFAASWRHVGRTEVVAQLALSAADAALLVAMGPSAWHVEPAELRRRIAGLSEPLRVTTSVNLDSYHPAA